jgi:hypothetical protein
MVGQQFYQVLGGQGIGSSFPPPVNATRAPATTDLTSPNGYPYQIGQEWIYSNPSATPPYVIYTYYGAGNWEASSDSLGDILTMSDTTGTTIYPNSAGNVQIAGTANQITSTAGTNKDTLSIPTTFVAPGSITATTTLTATAGNITASAGGLVGTAASTITIPSGSAVGLTIDTTGGTGVSEILKSSAATVDTLQLVGGGIKMAPVTGTGTTGATASGRVGQVSYTTALAGTTAGTYTITNTLVTSASIVQCTASCLTIGSAVVVAAAVPSTATITLTLYNGGGTSSAGADIFVTFQVFN